MFSSPGCRAGCEQGRCYAGFVTALYAKGECVKDSGLVSCDNIRQESKHKSAQQARANERVTPSRFCRCAKFGIARFYLLEVECICRVCGLYVKPGRNVSQIARELILPYSSAHKLVQLIQCGFSSQSFWKAGSPRSGSNIGSSRSSAGVSGV